MKLKDRVQENPRVTAVKRILNIAELLRTRGTPEQAEEAIEWEKQLRRRLQVLEKEEMATAA